MENNVRLTIALAVYNEEKNLEACLSSVKDLGNELIIVDGGSTDKTIEISKKYGAKIIQTDNPPMFHINKQKALEASTGTWILQLDADEVVTPALKKEILQVTGQIANSKEQNEQETGNKKQEESAVHGYYIARKNYFWGRFMTKGGTYPDEVIRLVKNGYAKFPCQSVHEQIEIEGNIGHVTEPMLHYSYRTRADYWKKADTYTTLTANMISMHMKQETGNNIFASVATFISYLFIKPIYTFFSLYIRHKGILDGLQGFEFALYSALHFPIAYGKYAKGIKHQA